MSTIEQIEDVYRQLSADERSAFRAWFTEYDAEEWDRLLEADVGTGCLG